MSTVLIWLILGRGNLMKEMSNNFPFTWTNSVRNYDSNIATADNVQLKMSSSIKSPFLGDTIF